MKNKQQNKKPNLPKRYSKSLVVKGAQIPQHVYDSIYEMNPMFYVDSDKIAVKRMPDNKISLEDNHTDIVIELEKSLEGNDSDLYIFFDNKLKEKKFADGGMMDEVIEQENDNFNLVEDPNAPAKPNSNIENKIDEVVDAAEDKLEPVEDVVEKIQDKAQDSGGMLWFIIGVCTAILIGKNS